MITQSQKILGIAVVAAIIIGIGGWKAPDIASAVKYNGAPEISKEAQAHILQGDKTGGGHLFGTGKPCKTEFPKDWSENDVLDNIRTVAANDNLKWKKQKNGYFVATDKVDDVRIKVVLDKEKDDVVTAYPVSGKPNSCKIGGKTAAAKPSAVKPAAKVAAPEVVEPAAGPVANASNRQPRTTNFNSR